MPQITRIEIYKANLPFKTVFRHSRKKRSVSESIFAKVCLDDAKIGFGEALPRDYVSGRTQESACRELIAYAPRLIGVKLETVQGSLDFVKALSALEGEARCALELALFDCIGKEFGKSVTELFGSAPQAQTRFVYSGVISADSLLKTILICLRARKEKFSFIKVKVGSAEDLLRLKLCRLLLGNVDLRVDANGAWDKNEAVTMSNKMRAYGISCIEQPVAKDDFAGLQYSANHCAQPIAADESLCTCEEARLLAHGKMCHVFNVRLSKCGGILRSLEIINIAKKNGLDYQIGCHVGESGILSAAGRHLAAIAGNPKYLEGCYSRWVLKEDVVLEDLTPQKGVGFPLIGPGFGVTVKETIIKKYSTQHEIIT